MLAINYIDFATMKQYAYNEACVVIEWEFRWRWLESNLLKVFIVCLKDILKAIAGSSLRGNNYWKVFMS
jgi:hypothetical protein